VERSGGETEECLLPRANEALIQFGSGTQKVDISIPIQQRLHIRKDGDIFKHTIFVDGGEVFSASNAALDLNSLILEIPVTMFDDDIHVRWSDGLL
jgi:hypothetical protein